MSQKSLGIIPKIISNHFTVEITLYINFQNMSGFFFYLITSVLVLHTARCDTIL